MLNFGLRCSCSLLQQPIFSNFYLNEIEIPMIHLHTKFYNLTYLEKKKLNTHLLSNDIDLNKVEICILQASRPILDVVFFYEKQTTRQVV